MLAWLGLATLWAGWTALTDARQRRIPNLLVLIGMGLALGRIGLLGDPAPGAAAVHALVALLALWPAWRWRLLGGGDVKLGAVVAAMHWTDFQIALAIGLAGALLAGRRRTGRLRLLPGAPPADGRLHGRGTPFAPLLLGPFLALAWWRYLG